MLFCFSQRVENAQKQLAQKQASLAEARAKLREASETSKFLSYCTFPFVCLNMICVVQLQEKLETLKKEYDEKLAQKEELKQKAEMLELKLERAAKLVSGLSGERVRWEESIKVTYCCSLYMQLTCVFLYTLETGGGHGLFGRRLSGCCSFPVLCWAVPIKLS